MRRLLATLLLLAGVPAAAQNTPTVTAHAEPDSILIGDRFDLVIDVEKDLVQVVEFPEFEDRDGKIEVVESLPVDTLERDGRRLKLRKRYRLAAFDEGRYNLGTARVLYADKNILDTLSSRDSVYLDTGSSLPSQISCSWAISSFSPQASKTYSLVVSPRISPAGESDTISRTMEPYMGWNISWVVLSARILKPMWLPRPILNRASAMPP